MNMGVAVAVFQHDKILLIQREDFEVWCLPGGGIDDGESIAQAAVREAREETGLDVRLTRFVGLYTRLGWHELTVAVFAADVIGGALKPQPNEVIDIGWFTRDAVPAALLWGYDQRIADAFEGVNGVCRLTHAATPYGFPQTREALYAARDASQLSRAAFYQWLLTQIQFTPSATEVPGLSKHEEVLTKP